ncbi:unnamed protein product, partial [Meganyctiphanes norvegica]
MSDQEIDNGDELFEDASDQVCEMDLATAMEQGKLACNYFFNNRFEEARALMRPWAHKSMYHALGYGTFMYLQAIMTFDPKDVEIAIDTLKQSVDVCNKFRRKTNITDSMVKMVKKPDYNAYTKTEIHAELCFAETLLLRSVLSFMEDETLISFLKGGMKIRECYKSYKECWYILEGRDWSNDPDKKHFESGVRMGVGTFNLMISQMPQKVLKLLEFVGFSGNKTLGLSELEKGFALEGSMRQVLCALVLLGYHLIGTYVLGTSEGNLVLTQKIIDNQMQLYPNGAWFLFFKARQAFVQGEFDEAVEIYTKSWNSQHEWTQFHHLCFWELMWCNIFRLNYKEAEKFASHLLTESKWSKCTYAYQKACCMIMRKDELTREEKAELADTMRNVPGLKQRIAGKSLPVEKFACKKSVRFFAQGENLTLAALELIYNWGGYKIVGKKYENIERIYLMVDAEMKDQESIREQFRDEFWWDNYLLAHLMKGCCLYYMKSPLQAEECFKFIVNNEKKIKEDTYLVPCALLELGLMLLHAGELDQAKLLLEHAKNNYKGYSLESRLHFRFHATLNKIAILQKGTPKETLSPLDAFPSRSPSPSSGTRSPSPTPPSGINASDIINGKSNKKKFHL